MGEDVTIGIVLGYDAEIVEADDAGYVSETTITDAELVEAPEGVDLSTFEAIIGVQYRQTFGADGTAGEIELVNEDELTAEQITAFEQFGSSINSAAALAFPAEPVGEGAQWISTTAIASQGIEVEVDYEYELLEVDGSNYVLDITYDEDLDTEIEQGGQTGQLTGTVDGTGSVQGSADNPLLTTTELTQGFDFTVEADGQTIDVQMNIEVLLENS